MSEALFPDVQAPLSEWLATAVELLPDSESAKLDLEILLCQILDKSRTFLYTWPETRLTQDQYQALVSSLVLRQKGHPIAHIVGHREFWSLPLRVSPATLIPRPDTEVLIEWVVETFCDLNPVEPKTVVDLGTGTGAIALALASEFPTWQVSGCDLIPEAVALARSNAQSLGLDRVHFFEGHWFDQFDPESDANRYHLIVSNPPYIPKNDRHLSEGDVVFEPKSALVSGDDGLDDIRLIINEAMHYLVEGGCLLLEHGYDQADSVSSLMVDAGYERVGVGQDYGGNDRFTYGWKRN